jgi:enamine deaminase RidA (YjgF/YER057c/UK114 family)
MRKIQNKLEALGITLPEAAKPVANYAGYQRAGRHVLISGQLPMEDGKLKYVGKVGSEISTQEAAKAARLCALNILAQLKDACEGNLDRVLSCVKLGIFINAEPDFKDHPQVANGASDLMVEVFGRLGIHARAAVGSGSLPFGVAVEIDAMFEINYIDDL